MSSWCCSWENMSVALSNRMGCCLIQLFNHLQQIFLSLRQRITEEGENMLALSCLHWALLLAQFATNLIYISLTTQFQRGICGEEVKEGHFLFFLAKFSFCFQKSCCSSVFLLSVFYTKYSKSFLQLAVPQIKGFPTLPLVCFPPSLKDVITKKCASWKSIYIFFDSVYLITLHCATETTVSWSYSSEQKAF